MKVSYEMPAFRGQFDDVTDVTDVTAVTDVTGVTDVTDVIDKDVSFGMIIPKFCVPSMLLII